GQNWHRGYMGCYLPRVHILSKAEFEALGDQFSVKDIPIWVHDRPEIGLSVAQDAPVTASSVFDSNPENAASNAVDPNYDSFWFSETLASPQEAESMTIDLGEERWISGVKLSWLILAHATEYQLDVSVDGQNWDSFFSTTNGDGGIDIVDHLQDVRGRYIRIRMFRALLFNYGLQNVEIYSPDTECLGENTTNVLPVLVPAAAPVLAFPNPSSGWVHFKGLQAEDWESVQVYDTKGRLLINKAFTNPFSLVGLPAGQYHLALIGERARSTVKISLQ
ncbi:MAG: discoidin domain-containing protein, partial [Bacteroidota bacterium]